MKINKVICEFCVSFFFSIIFVFICIAKDYPDAILNSLPNQINTFIAEAPYTYPQKELGTSIGYNASGKGIITVYLYDFGMQNIEDGIKSQPVLRSKEMAMKDIKTLEARGLYRNVTIKIDEPAVLNLPGGRSLETLYVSYLYDAVNQDGKSLDPVVSDLYVVGLKGYICKIRATRRLYVGADEVRGVVGTIVSNLIKPTEPITR